jgi:hypothetical protein
MSLSENGHFRRGLLGSLARLMRPPRLHPTVREVRDRGSTWKLEKYRRGERVTVDAAPFLGTS